MSGGATRNGRALPPRPGLLVGGEEECEAAWQRLRPLALQLLSQLPAWRTTAEDQTECEAAVAALAATAGPKPTPPTIPSHHTHQRPTSGGRHPTNRSHTHQSPTPHVAPTHAKSVATDLLQPASSPEHALQQRVDALAALVDRLRWLRESLVSNRMMATPLAVQVYEMSVDVAAASGMGAAPELLKALQGLVGSTGLYEQYSCTKAQYSSTDRAGQTGGSAGQAREGGARGAHHTTATFPTPSLCARAAEMAAAHVLFFACVPSHAQPGEVAGVLSALARGPYWGTPEVQFAVSAVAALARGDFTALFTMRMRPPASRAPWGNLGGGSSGGSSSSSSSSSSSWVDRGMQQGALGRSSSSSASRSCGSRLLAEMLDSKLGAARLLALRVLAASYRSLPVRPAVQLLGLWPSREQYSSTVAAGVLHGPGGGGSTARTAHGAQHDTGSTARTVHGAQHDTGSTARAAGRGLDHTTQQQAGCTEQPSQVQGPQASVQALQQPQQQGVQWLHSLMSQPLPVGCVPCEGWVVAPGALRWWVVPQGGAEGTLGTADAAWHDGDHSSNTTNGSSSSDNNGRSSGNNNRGSSNTNNNGSSNNTNGSSSSNTNNGSSSGNNNGSSGLLALETTTGAPVMGGQLGAALVGLLHAGAGMAGGRGAATALAALQELWGSSRSSGGTQCELNLNLSGEGGRGGTRGERGRGAGEAVRAPEGGAPPVVTQLVFKT